MRNIQFIIKKPSIVTGISCASKSDVTALSPAVGQQIKEMKASELIGTIEPDGHNPKVADFTDLP